MNKNNPCIPDGQDCALVGGQAVLEGVMMRNGDVYGLAVRMPDGKIRAAQYKWYSITDASFLMLPFIRGFPVLVETIINGIQALNRSIALYEQEQQHKRTLWESFLSVALACVLAVTIFIIAPHMLAILMHGFSLGADVDGFSFHLWDGLFKCAIFILYIWLISFIPAIKRVYQYHGAEHKTIYAYEAGIRVSDSSSLSRLHPRCGTTFLLFVIFISILIQAVAIPALLLLWTPENSFIKHFLVIIYKLALVIPISGLAYELIRFAVFHLTGLCSLLLLSPGLLLQRLTTCEPDAGQMEVAMAALAQALRPQETRDSSMPHLY